MSESPDDEVSQLLHAWGLSDLKAKFKANYIVLQALEYLTEQDIVELIPKIGQRAIFRGRLREWRQQNGITSMPALKICKLEPVSDSKPEQQTNVTNNSSTKQSSPIQTLPRQEPARHAPPKLPSPRQVPSIQTLAKQAPARQEPVRQMPIVQEPIRQEPVRQAPVKQLPAKTSPLRDQSTLQSPPQIVHKIYGTLVKCGSKAKKPTDNTSTSVMQSKVQQFYISPPVVDTPPPQSPPFPTRKPRIILPKPDLTPFVTSIIRVETNCDKSYSKTSPSAAQSKINRTTILQKLNNSKGTSSPPSNTSNPSEHTEEQKEEREEELPEPLYPIVKLETEFDNINWNAYGEPEPDPEPGPEPEPEPESYEAINKEDDDLMVDTSDIQTECIETLDSDSALEFDSENDSAGLLLERMTPQPKKKRSILGKLDIRNILMNSDMGRHVLSFYEANERLDLGRRRMLIEAIVQDCWVTNRRISPTDCSTIADEIIEILPNERVEDYYLAQPGKNPKSPLYNKYRNMHNRFFLEKGLPIPIRRKKRKSRPRQIPEPEEYEMDDDIIIS